jgi:transposase-like protein
MNNQKQGVPSKYPPDLKIAIAREYLSSDLGYGALGIKYGYPTTTVIHFVKWYRDHYPDDLIAVAPSSAVADTKEDKAVSKQLAEANLKIAALEMLIQNASKELGVDLVKKHGTKRSAK